MTKVSSYIHIIKSNIQTDMESQVKRYETEALTKQELKRLKSMTTGYGNFQKVSDQAEMPVVTLRSIVQRGYGKPETIKKIREAILTEE